MEKFSVSFKSLLTMIFKKEKLDKACRCFENVINQRWVKFTAAFVIITAMVFFSVHEAVEYYYMQPFFKDAEKGERGWYSKVVDGVLVETNGFGNHDFYAFVRLTKLDVDNVYVDPNNEEEERNISITMFAWTGPFTQEMGLHCSELQDQDTIYFYQFLINDQLEFVPQDDDDVYYQEFARSMIHERKAEIEELYRVYQTMVVDKVK